jgi:hypothetical protein
MDGAMGCRCSTDRAGTSQIARLALTGTIIAALATPSNGHAAKPAPGIGINLFTLTSIGQEIPFVDAFKMSSPWILKRRGQEAFAGAPQLTADGWVASLAAGDSALAFMFNGGDGHYPGGIYSIFYDGEGTLRFGGDGVRVLAGNPGEIKLDVKPQSGRGSGIVLEEVATNPVNPLRNIRVILPGFERTYRSQPFNPVFLTRLAPFRTIRFMTWQRTNRSNAVNWSDRRTAEYATQASAVGVAPQVMTGVALEYQIDLANALGADAWFNVPIKASDDYVREMARLVHRRLRPELQPMIELSNEVWNDYFVDAAYAQDQGVALALDPRRHAAGIAWYARRATQVFDIWNEVYGNDQGKIVRIIAAGQTLPPVGEAMLAFENTYKKTDALAVGGYVSPPALRDGDRYPAIAKMTTEEALAAMDGEAKTKMRTLFEAHAAIARRYGVELIVYEGGPGIESSRVPDPYQTAVTGLFTAVNRHPLIAQVYNDLLDSWFAAGGGLFVHFQDVVAPGRFGQWGLLEYQDQAPDTAPKYQALTRYIAAHRFLLPPVGGGGAQ